MLFRLVDYSNFFDAPFPVPSDRKIDPRYFLTKNRTWDRRRTHFLFHRYVVIMGGTARQVVLLPSLIPVPHARGESQYFNQNQVVLLISHFPWNPKKQQTNQLRMASPKWGGRWFSVTKGGEGEGGKAEKRKRRAYLSFRAASGHFDGTMKETKSFVSSLILYIYGRKAEFPSNESKIMFAAIVYSGRKSAILEKMKPSIWLQPGRSRFKDFKDFITQLEAQFGDPSPKSYRPSGN